MFISLEDLLVQVENKGMRCVAGFRGLSNQIHGFTIIDTPDILRWIKGGEFVVSSGYVLNDNPTQCKMLVKDLANRGCAGLGIKTNYHFDDIPAALVEEGEKYDFPIIELDYSLRFSDIAFFIHQNMFKNDMTTTEKSNLIYRKIVKIILSDQSVEHMLYNICEVVMNPVFLVNKKFELLAFENPSENLIPLDTIFNVEKGAGILGKDFVEQTMNFFIETHFDFHKIMIHNGELITNVIVVPIELENVHWGFLLIPEVVKPLDKETYQIIGSIKSAVGVYFLKNSLSARAISEQNNSFLNNVLLNSNNTCHNIAHYSDIFGFDYKKKRAAINVQAKNYTFFSYEKRNKIYKTIDYSIGEIAKKNEITYFDAYFKDNFVTFFFFSPNSTSGEIVETLESIATEIELRMEKHGIDVKIAVSDCTQDILDIPIAFKQSIDIIPLGEKLEAEKSTYFYSDLYVYYVLLTAMSETELKNIAKPICKLHDEDISNGTNYVETLEIFIKNKFNLSKAALAMYLHRNSLGYRLTKIQESLGINLEKQEELFKLQLALYAFKILL